MTGSQFVDLMNDVLCLHHDARSAILGALRDPTVERITAALATTKHAALFVDGLFDSDGVPLIDEASIWLAVRGGELPVFEPEPEPEPEPTPPEPIPPVAEKHLASCLFEGGRWFCAADCPHHVIVDVDATKYRCVRVKRDGSIQNVTRAMSWLQCDAYRTIKNDPKLRIEAVA